MTETATAAEVPTLDYEGRSFRFPWHDRQPKLDPRARERLKRSIKKRGVRIAVEVDEHDNVIDGFNRLHIAKEVHIPLSEIPFVLRLDPEREKEEWADSVNEDRRQQTEEEIAAAAAKRRERVKARKAETPSISNREQARIEGVSEITIRRDLETSEGENATGVAPTHVTQPSEVANSPAPESNGRANGQGAAERLKAKMRGKDAAPAEQPADPAPAPPAEAAAPAQLTEAVAAMDAGSSQREAAELVGVPESTLRVWLKRWADQVAALRERSRQAARARAAAEPPPPAEVLDEVGAKVPPSLVEVFNLRPKFQQHLQQQKAMTAFLSSIEDRLGGRYVPLAGRVASRECFTQVSRGVPYAVCPPCGGRGCQRCANNGYLNQSGYDQWLKSAKPKGAAK